MRSQLRHSHLIEHEGKEAILVWGAERLSAHSAEDGEMHWVSTGFNPKQKKNWVVVGSQVVAGGVAVVPYGQGHTLREFAWEATEASRSRISYGPGRIRGISYPVRRWLMARSFAGPRRGPLHRSQDREKPLGGMPFHVPVRVSMLHPRWRGPNSMLRGGWSDPDRGGGQGFKFLGAFDMGEQVIPYVPSGTAF